MKIYDIRERPEFLKEVAELTQKEWGSLTTSTDAFNEKISRIYCKMEKNCIIFHFRNESLLGILWMDF